MRLPQMFGEGTLRAEGEKEMNACGRSLLCGADMSLEIFNLHDYAVLIGEGFYPRSPMSARGHVHEKNTEEKADHEGKSQVFLEPGERGENMRVDQKIVSRAEQCPEEGE